jgi:hypothetical protein
MGNKMGSTETVSKQNVDGLVTNRTFHREVMPLSDDEFQEFIKDVQSRYQQLNIFLHVRELQIPTSSMDPSIFRSYPNIKSLTLTVDDDWEGAFNGEIEAMGSEDMFPRLQTLVLRSNSTPPATLRNGKIPNPLNAWLGRVVRLSISQLTNERDLQLIKDLLSRGKPINTMVVNWLQMESLASHPETDPKTILNNVAILRVTLPRDISLTDASVKLLKNWVSTRSVRTNESQLFCSVEYLTNELQNMLFKPKDKPLDYPLEDMDASDSDRDHPMDTGDHIGNNDLRSNALRGLASFHLTINDVNENIEENDAWGQLVNVITHTTFAVHFNSSPTKNMLLWLGRLTQILMSRSYKMNTHMWFSCNKDAWGHIHPFIDSMVDVHVSTMNDMIEDHLNNNEETGATHRVNPIDVLNTIDRTCTLHLTVHVVTDTPIEYNYPAMRRKTLAQALVTNKLLEINIINQDEGLNQQAKVQRSI